MTQKKTIGRRQKGRRRDSSRQSLTKITWEEYDTLIEVSQACNRNGAATEDLVDLEGLFGLVLEVDGVCRRHGTTIKDVIKLLKNTENGWNVEERDTVQRSEKATDDDVERGENYG